MEAQRYQITQDDKDYILSTRLIGEKIRIECQDINFDSSPEYSRDYSLSELKSFSEIFNFISSVSEAQNEFNNAIERQQIRITNIGEFMEIAFNVQINSYAQELTFQLPMKQILSPNYIKPTEATPAAPISSTTIVKQPIYKDVQIPMYNTTNQQVEENGYQDYSYTQNGAPQQVYPNTQTDMGYGSSLDHDRINKIEGNSQILKGEHDGIKQRLNNLKMKIQMIKTETSDIRRENGVLNMKTLDLKKQYNNLIEAEAALRAENDDLRREKHELILKKNELGFYIREHPDHDTVREVNIPIDEKRRRTTNVSKREKQFGGGYSSSTTNAYKQTGGDTGYTSSTMGNKNNYGNEDYY